MNIDLKHAYYLSSLTIRDIFNRYKRVAGQISDIRKCIFFIGFIEYLKRDNL